MLWGGAVAVLAWHTDRGTGTPPSGTLYASTDRVARSRPLLTAVVAYTAVHGCRGCAEYTGPAPVAP
ncbi:hypothetical protein [Streptomyces sp. NPDC058665]|uniref:hypothetical protein n=1 Tax=Streptomyces sp. NPDC058665 TaxID=3346586 RepID=UPI0036608061